MTYTRTRYVRRYCPWILRLITRCCMIRGYLVYGTGMRCTDSNQWYAIGCPVGRLDHPVSCGYSPSTSRPANKQDVLHTVCTNSYDTINSTWYTYSHFNLVWSCLQYFEPVHSYAYEYFSCDHGLRLWRCENNKMNRNDNKPQLRAILDKTYKLVSPFTMCALLFSAPSYQYQ